MNLIDSETTAFLQFTETHSLALRFIYLRTSLHPDQVSGERLVPTHFFVASPIRSRDRHSVHAEPQPAAD